jgi:heme-degrading monooxygenase HmoA
MVAQITTAQIRLGRTDDLIRVLQDIVAPTMTEQPGFQGLTLLIDPQTDRVLLLGLWATEADLIASERRDPSHMQFATLDELLEGSSLREAYEVILHVQMTADGAARIRGI